MSEEAIMSGRWRDAIGRPHNFDRGGFDDPTNWRCDTPDPVGARRAPEGCTLSHNATKVGGVVSAVSRFVLRY